ncbi:MAG: hypothetical protein HQL44_12745 [Alphaproteobacteria bacterium]|nr:hypothetical protein [Alphaproteobacteria bacterium]
MSGEFERRRQGLPVTIDDLDDFETARVLRRVSLTQGNEGKSYDEGWLQRLIYSFPQSLPITDIEPRFEEVVPVCMELPTTAGYADNLFMTPDGDIVLVECKLWRNPQARREVVMQAIDYAHSMSDWSYQDLEAAIAKANRGKTEKSLFDIVTREQGGDEVSFIDAVSRNLRLGRILLLIVGDGIREDVETLTGFLQDHAGSHFTLGLVEMAVYALSQSMGGHLVLPSVMARTVLIERGIVRIASDGRVEVAPLENDGKRLVGAVSQRYSISSDEFFETLAKLAPGMSERLQTFLDKMSETLNAYYLFGRGMKLILRTEQGDAPLGHIYAEAGWGEPKGTPYFTCYTARRGRDIGRIDADMAYFSDIAEVVGGKVVDIRKDGKPMREPYVAEPPHYYGIHLSTMLDKQDEFLRAFEAYKDRLESAQE